MSTNRIYIRNMVCDRCIKVVKEELERFGLHPICVHIGEVVLMEKIDKNILYKISKMLSSNGLSLIEDKKMKIIERIKLTIIDLIHQKQDLNNRNYSNYLSEKLHTDYNYLSSLFSSMESITIEKYIILQKIERIKELLIYNEFTLEQISDQMGYSSAQYLSNQFKKITGLTPSQFRKVHDIRRKSLDQV